MDGRMLSADIAWHHSTAGFEAISWCAALLNQPGIVYFTPTSCATESSSSGGRLSHDQLFRRSLKLSNAVPRCVGFYQQGQIQSSPIEHNAAASCQPESRFQVTQCSLLFDLQPGVNGYNGTAHGGIIAALMDEAMGNLLVLNAESQLHQSKEGTSLSPSVLNLAKVVSIFTAQMDIRLKQPIATPQVVVVTAAVQRIEGRKIHFNVTTRGEGEVEYASCESIWVLSLKVKL